MSNDKKIPIKVIIKVELTDEEKEIADIQKKLKFHPRRAEVGAVIKIGALELLEPKEASKLKIPYIYGLLTGVEDVCEATTDQAFQIEWAVGHIHLGNSFFNLVAPQWEHMLRVCKFEDEYDEGEDSEFTKLFQKVKGKWELVDTYTCEFCDSRRCDRALFKDELEEVISEQRMVEKDNDEKRYTVYGRFTWEKHGRLGRHVRREIDDCVLELTYLSFPVELGKRKRGFKPTVVNLF